MLDNNETKRDIDLSVVAAAAATTAAAKNKIEEDYGYIIFESILNFLFPERFENGVNGVPPNFNPTLEDTPVPFTSCFEDGSFVFNDPNAGLFKILLGANDEGDIGVRLGQYMSVKNKMISGDDDAEFLGEENEWLVQYCKRKLETEHYDYFIFGHRHLPLEIELNERSKYINLGDWIHYFTYGVIEEEIISLKKY